MMLVLVQQLVLTKMVPMHYNIHIMQPVLSDDLAICFYPPQVGPDLEVGSYKAASSDISIYNQPLTYTIYISNSGNGDAMNAVLTDAVPVNTNYIPGSLSASSGTPSFANNTVSWSGVVTAGESVLVSFAVEPTIAACATEVENIATISDPDLNDDVNVSVATGIANQLYNDWQFNISDDGFVGSGEWEWGDLVPNAVPEAPPEPYDGRLWATNLAGLITSEPSDHYLTRTITLPADNEGLYLSWVDWWDGDVTQDYGYVMIDATTLYTITADQHSWQQHIVNLSAWAGQTIDIVFYYQATGAGTGGAGWYVDNVRIYSGCAPVIEVTPDNLSSTQPQDVQITGTLSIANPGSLNLNWSITEEDSGSSCQANDIPWLIVNPTLGTTPPNMGTNIEVTFDSTGLAPDVYTGTLCVESNAIVSSTIIVPVTLTVPLDPAIVVTKTVGTESDLCALNF